MKKRSRRFRNWLVWWLQQKRKERNATTSFPSYILSALSYLVGDSSSGELVDSIGTTTPPAGYDYKAQSFLFNGTAYLALTGILATDTVTNSGDSTLSTDTNKLEGTAGDAWDITITSSGGTDKYWISGCDAVGTSIPVLDLVNGGTVYAVLTSGTLPDFYATHQDGVTGFNQNTLGFSQRENLLKYSEDLTKIEWQKVGTASITGTNILNLPAVNDATFNNSYLLAIPAGTNITGTVKVSGTAGQTVDLRIYRSSGTYEYSSIEITLTATPTVYSVSHTVTNSDIMGFYLRVERITGQTATQVECEYAQLEFASESGEYIATTTSPIQGIQPADPINSALDITGNTLQYPGPIKKNAELTGYTGTWDGTAYLANANLVGTETVTASNGTSTPSISAGKIDFTAGWCSDLTLSNGDRIIIESSVTSTQTNYYSVTSSEVYVLTTATTPFCTTESQEATYLLENGWELSSGNYIPAKAAGGESAAGNALTASPGDLRTVEPGFFEMPQSKDLLNADIVAQAPNAAIEFFFQSDGTQEEITYADLSASPFVDGAVNDQYFFSTTKGLAIYDEPQDADDVIQIEDYMEIT